jgi:hypothetical protein
MNCKRKRRNNDGIMMVAGDGEPMREECKRKRRN